MKISRRKFIQVSVGGTVLATIAPMEIFEKFPEVARRRHYMKGVSLVVETGTDVSTIRKSALVMKKPDGKVLKLSPLKKIDRSRLGYSTNGKELDQEGIYTIHVVGRLGDMAVTGAPSTFEVNTFANG